MTIGVSLLVHRFNRIWLVGHNVFCHRFIVLFLFDLNAALQFWSTLKFPTLIYNKLDPGLGLILKISTVLLFWQFGWWLLPSIICGVTQFYEAVGGCRQLFIIPWMSIYLLPIKSILKSLSNLNLSKKLTYDQNIF